MALLTPTLTPKLTAKHNTPTLQLIDHSII